jgi:hypothetical protein
MGDLPWPVGESTTTPRCPPEHRSANPASTTRFASRAGDTANSSTIDRPTSPLAVVVPSLAAQRRRVHRSMASHDICKMQPRQTSRSSIPFSQAEPARAGDADPAAPSTMKSDRHVPHVGRPRQQPTARDACPQYCCCRITDGPISLDRKYLSPSAGRASVTSESTRSANRSAIDYLAAT